jgi:hydroxymethylpyrimidine/phosphomethylpyrimidine kinase
MKPQCTNLWKGPGSTFASAITAALTFILAADVELPKGVLVAAGAISAALSILAGPQKPKN